MEGFHFGAQPWVYPQPVLIIASYGEDGTPDAMNAAWGGVADSSRIAMYLSGGHKTVKNILKRGAFTVSMGDAEHAAACDYVGIESGNSMPDEVARAGFHVTKSEHVDAPVIDELPPGRRPIKTVHYTDAARLRLFGFMKQEIAKGRQVYVVYPLIKESEAMDYKDLTDGYEAISRDFPLPDYVTTICHGKMKPADKEESMRQFKSGEADIMVATSVIEVGVDVPNATVMVIESAERFGLSQLHQLRGRVGRGGEQSYCILMSGEKLSKESRARLDAMCETNDGFRLAELDLKLRGAGDINGTLQSGMAFDLKIANPTLDVQILTVSREAAAGILSGDRGLSLPEHRGLRELRRRYSGREEIDFSMIS